MVGLRGTVLGLDQDEGLAGKSPAGFWANRRSQQRRCPPPRIVKSRLIPGRHGCHSSHINHIGNKTVVKPASQATRVGYTTSHGARVSSTSGTKNNKSDAPIG